MRVLIVDSSMQIIDRLEEILSESTVITAIDKTVSFAGAARLFRDNNPEVVLLDIHLPGNDSFNLLKEMKKPGCKTSVIILSLQTDHCMQQKCERLGADFVFDKYHDFEKIPGVIEAIACNTDLF